MSLPAPRTAELDNEAVAASTSEVMVYCGSPEARPGNGPNEKVPDRGSRGDLSGPDLGLGRRLGHLLGLDRAATWTNLRVEGAGAPHARLTSAGGGEVAARFGVSRRTTAEGSEASTPECVYQAISVDRYWPVLSIPTRTLYAVILELIHPRIGRTRLQPVVAGKGVSSGRWRGCG
jgi:hypothetical protein